VFLELASRFKEVWYWISKGKFEVDFIVREQDGTLQAFQVSLSIRNSETRAREIRAVEAAFAELQVEKAWVITESERETITVSGRQVEVVPFYRWATA
jgi:predicted AAA+ superfamily ATPase